MDIISIALKEYGTHDILGTNSNPRVLQYFKDIGQAWVKDDDTAWCAAFIGWVLKQAGKPSTGSLAARSYLNYGVATDSPELGDLVVFWRINKVGPYGHVAIFVKDAGDMIYVLGGNQSDGVNITAFAKANVLGYRKIPTIQHA